MGRTIKIRYVVEMDYIVLQGKRFYSTPTEWPGKYVGRVSPANLEKVVASFVDSLGTGQPNEHLRKAGILGVHQARVYDQFNDRKLVCEWRKP